MFDDPRLPSRFWIKTIPEPNSGCWLWLAAVNDKGYGKFIYGDQQLAHRVSYIVLRGIIPEGLELDHKCRTRSCVNPFHLEAVTHIQNMQRSPFAQQGSHPLKEHCPNGHPYTGENLYMRPDGRGRGCRLCKASAKRAYRERHGLKRPRQAHYTTSRNPKS